MSKNHYTLAEMARILKIGYHRVRYLVANYSHPEGFVHKKGKTYIKESEMLRLSKLKEEQSSVRGYIDLVAVAKKLGMAKSGAYDFVAEKIDASFVKKIDGKIYVKTAEVSRIRKLRAKQERNYEKKTGTYKPVHNGRPKSSKPWHPMALTRRTGLEPEWGGKHG
jgi:hypothetical protein